MSFTMGGGIAAGAMRLQPASPDLSWQLLKLPKPRLRWPRMRQHHWLPGHGLLQHKAWLHWLHHLIERYRKSGTGGTTVEADRFDL